MNPAFSFGLGFLYPAGLLAAPLILGLLVYAYLKRGRGKQTPVPTLLLMQNLKHTSTARQKFIPPPRFFFELLVLLLLIAAAAGLYRQGPEEKIILLIDNSLSMSAAPADAALTNSTVLVKALSEAAAELSGSGSAGQARIYLTSPYLQALGNSFETKDSAKEKLSKIEPIFAADNLQAALLKLSTDASAHEIRVYTDKSPASDPAASAGAAPKKGKFRFVPLIDSAVRSQNIAIQDISLSQDPLAEKQASLKVILQSFAEQSADVKVALEALSGDSSNLSPLDSRTVGLKPHGTESVVFSNLPRGAAAFKAALQVLNRPLGGRLDSIKDDNTAWITYAGRREKITLVSEFSAQSLGLDKIPALHFEAFHPRDFLAQPERTEALESAPDAPAAFVFHRCAPQVLPPANALFVLPPENNAIFKFRRPSALPDVTRWLTSHPIINYLNLPVLTFKALNPFVSLPWTAELISTTGGPAALVGQTGGRRYVALGFELFPYEGKASPLMSILTLNIFKWLSDFSTSTGFDPPYSALKADRQVKEAVYLDGQTITLEGEGDERGIIPAKPGLIVLRLADGAARYHAVNFFNQEESDTSAAHTVTLPQSPQSFPAGSDKRVFSQLLASFALALLLIDLALAALPKRFKIMRH